MGLQYAISIMNINLSSCNAEFAKANAGAKNAIFSVVTRAIIVHEFLVLTFWLLWM
jgi:hypothetical protein